MWAIATIDLIRKTRSDLGISLGFKHAYQYMDIAYYNIVEGKAITTSTSDGRYRLHSDCGSNARDILIDIGLLDPVVGNDLAIRTWLDDVEPKF